MCFPFAFQILHHKVPFEISAQLRRSTESTAALFTDNSQSVIFVAYDLIVDSPLQVLGDYAEGRRQIHEICRQNLVPKVSRTSPREPYVRRLKHCCMSFSSNVVPLPVFYGAPMMVSRLMTKGFTAISL